jgi:hypothetical protein
MTKDVRFVKNRCVRIECNSANGGTRLGTEGDSEAARVA